eukprot:365304-Chlamydomonas_euryale.AAC.5
MFKALCCKPQCLHPYASSTMLQALCFNPNASSPTLQALGLKACALNPIKTVRCQSSTFKRTHAQRGIQVTLGAASVTAITPPPPAPPGGDGGGGLSDGDIAGIIIGVVLGLTALAALAWFFAGRLFMRKGPEAEYAVADPRMVVWHNQLADAKHAAAGGGYQHYLSTAADGALFGGGARGSGRITVHAEADAEGIDITLPALPGPAAKQAAAFQSYAQ